MKKNKKPTRAESLANKVGNKMYGSPSHVNTKNRVVTLRTRVDPNRMPWDKYEVFRVSKGANKKKKK